MIDEKKVSEAGRPLPQVPGSGEEERLQAIDRAAMDGLATPNEAPREAGDEAAAQKTAGQTSAAVKREAERALGLTPTTSEKMEQRLGTATTGGTDAGEVSAQPPQRQDEAAKDGAASSGEMLEKVAEQAGLGEGPRRGSCATATVPISGGANYLGKISSRRPSRRLAAPQPCSPST